MIPFGPDLWLFDGPTVTGAAGFRFPTRMAAIRLEDRALMLWSPVALTADLRAAVDALGPVEHLVAPNDLHYLFLADWAAAYPGAKVHAAPGLTDETAGVAIDAVLGDDPDPAWAGVVDQAVLLGNRITTEVVFFHTPSKTVFVTDLVQQMPKDWYSGWRAWVARLDRMTASEPSMPRKFRLAFRDRRAARPAAARILAWPTESVVMAHGTPVEEGGAAVLRNAFGWLVR